MTDLNYVYVIGNKNREEIIELLNAPHDTVLHPLLYDCLFAPPFSGIVFDHVDLFGFSDPAVYLVILITYRLTQDQFSFIFLGFATGFLLDLLTQTAGAHTIAV